MPKAHRTTPQGSRTYPHLLATENYPPLLAAARKAEKIAHFRVHKLELEYRVAKDLAASDFDAAKLSEKTLRQWLASEFRGAAYMQYMEIVEEAINWAASSADNTLFLKRQSFPALLSALYARRQVVVDRLVAYIGVNTRPMGYKKDLHAAMLQAAVEGREDYARKLLALAGTREEQLALIAIADYKVIRAAYVHGQTQLADFYLGHGVNSEGRYTVLAADSCAVMLAVSSVFTELQPLFAKFALDARQIAALKVLYHPPALLSAVKNWDAGSVLDLLATVGDRDAALALLRHDNYAAARLAIGYGFNNIAKIFVNFEEDTKKTALAEILFSELSPKFVLYDATSGYVQSCKLLWPLVSDASKAQAISDGGFIRKLLENSHLRLFCALRTPSNLVTTINAANTHDPEWRIMVAVINRLNKSTNLYSLEIGRLVDAYAAIMPALQASKRFARRTFTALDENHQEIAGVNLDLTVNVLHHLTPGITKEQLARLLDLCARSFSGDQDDKFVQNHLRTLVDSKLIAQDNRNMALFLLRYEIEYVGFAHTLSRIRPQNPDITISAEPADKRARIEEEQTR